MQYLGISLNNISKFRLHEKANNIRRKVFGFDDATLTDPVSDETGTLTKFTIVFKQKSNYHNKYAILFDNS